MYKSSLTIGLLALFCARFNLVQGTILPPARVEEEDKADGITIDRFLFFFSLLLRLLIGVAQNQCSNNSGFEIHAQSDLDALSGCTTVTGNIVVKSVSFSDVTIPQSVEKVEGGVSLSQTPSIKSFTASGLRTITGTFELLNLTALESLSAPSLTSVGSINFVILPKLQTMTLGINEAGNVRISDTQLSALSGFSFTSVKDFGIGTALS